MKLKYVIAFTCMSLLFSNVYAATEAQEKILALNAVKKFADSIACSTTFEASNEWDKQTTIKDVYTIERNLKFGESIYYVFWGGNVGCNGGNRSHSLYVTKVQRNYFDGKFMVKLGATAYTNVDVGFYAFGSANINYETIQSIKQINSSKFEIVAWAEADKKWGGSDFSSKFVANKFRYILEKQRDDNWKILNQVLLEQNNYD